MKNASTNTLDTQKNDSKAPSIVIPNTVVELVISWDKIDTQFQKVIRKYQPQVKTSGFRKGKAPASLVIQTVGKSALYDEALEKVLPVAYTQLITEKKFEPLGLPAIKLIESEENKDWKFEVQIGLRPELKLGAYKKIIEKAKKESEKVLNEKKKTEAKVEKDEKQLEKQQQDEKNEKLNTVLRMLIEEIKPKVPQLIIEQEAERSLRDMDTQLRQLNIEPATYLKSLGKSVEDLQQEHLSRALGTWQVELLLHAIAEEEKIVISEEEVEKIAHAQPGNHLDHSSVRSVLRKQKVLDFLLEV